MIVSWIDGEFELTNNKERFAYTGPIKEYYKSNKIKLFEVPIKLGEIKNPKILQVGTHNVLFDWFDYTLYTEEHTGFQFFGIDVNPMFLFNKIESGFKLTELQKEFLEFYKKSCEYFKWAKGTIEFVIDNID